MHRFAIAWCLCLAVSSQATRLAAQEPESLAPGMRLRVAAPEQAPKRIVGTLTALDPSVLTIQTSKGRIAVRREAIRTLELSEQRSSKGKGALVGAGLGVVAALIAAAITEEGGFFTRKEISLITGIVSVPVGAGMVALAAPGERWVPVAAAAGAAEKDRRGSLQLALRIRF